MILDIEKLSESVNYDKKLLYTNLRLFIQNEPSLEIKLVKSFEVKNNAELYQATEDLYQMTEFLEVAKLQRNIRDLQALALHNNLNDTLAENLKESLVSMLGDLKEEVNYLLNEQNGN